jgi:predicted aspartyl protease
MKTHKKWLKVLFIILAITLVIAAALFGFVQYKIYQIKHTLSVCTLENKEFYDEIPFEFRKLIVVKVRLNDSEKLYDFILDTGAPTILSNSTLKEVRSGKTQEKKVRINDENAALSENIIRLQSLQIGDIRYTGVGALVMDESKMGMLNCIGFDGILGYNILQTCFWQINFRDLKIVISDQPGKMNYLKDAKVITYTKNIQETPLISTRINDTLSLDLMLDTGHNGSVTISDSLLVTQYQEKFPDLIVSYYSRPAITIQGDEKSQTAKSEKFYCQLSKFQIGDFIFQNCLISLGKEKREHSSGLIGNAFLKNFVLTLNYRQGQLYFFQLNNDALPANKPTFGIDIGPMGDQVIVSSLYSGSQAGEKGIEVGDQIIRIDTISLCNLTPEALCGFFTGEKKLLDTAMDSINLVIRKNNTDFSVTLSRYNVISSGAIQ